MIKVECDYCGGLLQNETHLFGKKFDSLDKHFCNNQCEMKLEVVNKLLTIYPDQLVDVITDMVEGLAIKESLKLIQSGNRTL